MAISEALIVCKPLVNNVIINPIPIHVQSGKAQLMAAGPSHLPTSPGTICQPI